jgi:inner membrane protein
MDNITHSLTGWILARAGLDRFGPWTTPTLIIAANLPDIDSLFYFPWVNKPKYLLEHRGLSHSIIGLAVEAIVFALIVWLIGKAMRKSLHDPPRFFPALLLCVIGVTSHLLLDWLNTYGVRPLLPFNERWFYGDMAMIIDPWMWMILGAGVFLGTRPSRRSRIFWVFVASLSTTIMFMAARANWVPWGVLVAWVLGISTIVFLQLKIFSAQPAHIPAHGGLMLLAIYLGLLFVASRASSSRAMKEYQASLPPSDQTAPLAVMHSATPTPGIPWRYQVLVQTPTTLDHYAVNLFASSITHTRLDARLGDPMLAKVRDTEEYIAWRKFARHPICNGAWDKDEKGRFYRLTLGDMRYKLNPRGDWSEMTLRIVQQTPEPAAAEDPPVLAPPAQP